MPQPKLRRFSRRTPELVSQAMREGDAGDRVCSRWSAAATVNTIITVGWSAVEGLLSEVTRVMLDRDTK